MEYKSNFSVDFHIEHPNSLDEHLGYELTENIIEYAVSIVCTHLLETFGQNNIEYIMLDEEEMIDSIHFIHYIVKTKNNYVINAPISFYLTEITPFIEKGKQVIMTMYQ